jgi:hypothetical protein
MSNETSTVARFVVGTDDAEIPEHVFEHARLARRCCAFPS